MNAISRPPGVDFFRLISGTRPPQRADRSGVGTLPTRAARYCDAVTTAAGFGWFVFPPVNLSLLWDGECIFWNYEGLSEWLPLSAAQFPNFAAAFDAAAPPEAEGASPPFLTALPEPGGVQIWTGLMARTAPGWSLLVRPTANHPAISGVSFYEGLVETDRWFGPLFTNFRLTRTDIPVHLDSNEPLAQVQPIPRAAYADQTLAAMRVIDGFGAREWADYITNVVEPADDPDRAPGRYAVSVRKRRRTECPYSGAALRTLEQTRSAEVTNQAAK